MNGSPGEVMPPPAAVCAAVVCVLGGFIDVRLAAAARDVVASARHAAISGGRKGRNIGVSMSVVWLMETVIARHA
jgi:hypothetical protein